MNKFRKSITSSILINATADKIWRVLVDFQSYSIWNPFIKSIEGDLIMGGKLAVKIKADDSRAILFRPKIIACLPEKELRWRGKLFIRGLFDGEHYFQIVSNGDATCNFVQGESFSGLLVPFIDLQATEDGFNSMNQKIKQRVEGFV